MSTVTPLLNLVKPATAEQFSLATYTNNLDLIDAGYGKLPEKIATGTSTISITSTQTNVTKTINLPAGFTGTPVVILQCNTNRGARSAMLVLDAYTISATQFIVKLQTADNAAIGTSYDIDFGWVAILL